MSYDFDDSIDRRHSESLKWNRYDEDVLPLWVADMDFRSPGPVIRALHERVEHGVFGYGSDPPELREVIVDRLQRLYDWRVSPEALVFSAEAHGGARQDEGSAAHPEQGGVSMAGSGGGDSAGSSGGSTIEAWQGRSYVVDSVLYVLGCGRAWTPGELIPSASPERAEWRSWTW